MAAVMLASGCLAGGGPGEHAGEHAEPGAAPGPGAAAGAGPDSGEPTAGGFLDVNGWQWFYTTADGIRFADIAAMLDDLHEAGTRVVGIYAPYDGDPGKWLGSMPLDFYDTAPGSGTLDDLTDLVEGAHQRGMKVVAYAGPLTIDRRSELFRTAEEQYAAGDRSSREVSAVTWASGDTAPLPTPAPGPSRWRRSETAGAYYWSLWGEVGLDLGRPGARAEVRRFVDFWLDTGLDGFMWDSGVPHPELRDTLVDLPLSRRGDGAWLTFEVTAAEEADTYTDYGLTAWFQLEDNDEENYYSLVVDGPATTSDLEEAMLVAQEAREDQRLTHAWSPWEHDRYPDARMLVQEAALLAGMGVGYGAPTWTGYLEWPADTRARWEQVLATVNAHPALRPSATREHVPSRPRATTFAMTSTADGGSQTALLVYNLSSEPSTVTLDLAGTGVGPGRVPVDLVGGLRQPTVAGPSYELRLPAYGYTLLETASGDAPTVCGTSCAV